MPDSVFSDHRYYLTGFPGGSDGKESACHVGNPGSIPGLGRSPGEGKGYTLQYSYLENSMDREAWQALVHGVSHLDVTECVHTHMRAHTHTQEVH